MEKENTGISFESLGLKESLVKEVLNMGYKNPTPIQAETIPLILQGKDVLGQAQTGTGKTAAFVLPTLNNIEDCNAQSRSPQVLVLAPTRELAIQVTEAFEAFAKGFANNISAVAIYGGQDYTRQIRALNRGVHIVVGTAGRIMDHMRKETLNLESIKTLILDEADEMLRMGFIDDVKWILSHTSDNCQRLLFSATMPRDVVNIADSYLRNPAKIHVKSKTTTASTVRQRFLVVKNINKLDALDRILSYETTDGVLVFVRTKTDTVEVASGLKNLGYNAASMSGDMSQGQRELIIDQFKSGKVKILVATDVVARGLDLDCISHVINYELPQDNEAYVHRIGRTGRAGREGDAISLVTMRDMRQLQILERSIKQPLEEMYLPSAADITKKRIENFKKEVLKTMEQSGLEKYTSIMQEFKKEYFDINLEDLLGALTFMIQKDKPLHVAEIPTSRFEERPQIRTNQRDFGNDRRRENRDNRENRNLRKQERHSDNRSSIPMITYRVEVGINHGVQVRNIVGAIANESGLEGSAIGQIRIFDEYSTVKLPSNIPAPILQKIKNLRVANIRLDLKEMVR